MPLGRLDGGMLLSFLWLSNINYIKHLMPQTDFKLMGFLHHAVE